MMSGEQGAQGALGAQVEMSGFVLYQHELVATVTPVAQHAPDPAGLVPPHRDLHPVT